MGHDDTAVAAMLPVEMRLAFVVTIDWQLLVERLIEHVVVVVIVVAFVVLGAMAAASRS